MPVYPGALCHLFTTFHRPGRRWVIFLFGSMEIFLLLLWVVCGLGTLAVASQRGGSGLGALALGFLLGPLCLARSFAVFEGRQCPNCTWDTASLFLKNASVLSARARAAGSPARIRSRSAGASGALTPPGTIQDGCTRSLARPSMICCPNLRSATPALAISGFCSIGSKTLRSAGSESKPSSVQRDRLC